MAGAIANKGNQIGMGRATGNSFIQQGAYHLDQFQITDLILSANVIAPTQFTLGQHGQQGIGVIFDKQPITHVSAVAVDRDRLASERLEDHHRHQLFGEVKRPVVI